MGGFFHNLRHPRRCYMVCAIARSGSNFLTDGLHATRRAGRPKQFFLPKFEADYGGRHGLDAAEDFGGYVNGIIPTAATSNEVFGFKVMGWYLEDFLNRLRKSSLFGGAAHSGLGGAAPSDLEVLNQAFPRLQFVQILRRNKVQQAISKAKAMQSGLWKVQDGNAASAAPRFDEALIAKCLEETRQDEETWSGFFSRTGAVPFLVHYEDLCDDYARVLRGVLDFLKIRLPRGEDISPPQTVRQTDSLSREWEERFLALHPAATAPLTA